MPPSWQAVTLPTQSLLLWRHSRELRPTLHPHWINCLFCWRKNIIWADGSNKVHHDEGDITGKAQDQLIAWHPLRKQRGMSTCALFISFPCSLGPQPTEWHHPHVGWVSPPQPNLDIPCKYPQRFVSKVILDPIKLTTNNNHHDLILSQLDTSLLIHSLLPFYFICSWPLF